MNKKLLLDSHILLWLLQEPHKIGPKTTDLLRDSDQNYISLATIWELGIKHEKGKLAFSASELLGAVDKLGMSILKITQESVINATELKILHKDPFDKMLLAQAKTENLLLVTADAQMVGLGLDYVVEAGS